MKRILYFIILAVFVTSCSNKDDSVNSLRTPLERQSFLMGKWKLLRVINPFSTKTTYYEYKDIIFNFKEKGKVTVSSDNKAFSKGEYSYKITSESITANEKNTIKMVVIDGIKFTYKYENNELELSNAYVDGVILYLTKLENKK